MLEYVRSWSVLLFCIYFHIHFISMHGRMDGWMDGCIWFWKLATGNSIWNMITTELMWIILWCAKIERKQYIRCIHRWHRAHRTLHTHSVNHSHLKCHTARHIQNDPSVIIDFSSNFHNVSCVCVCALHAVNVYMHIADAQYWHMHIAHTVDSEQERAREPVIAVKIVYCKNQNDLHLVRKVSTRN